MTALAWIPRKTCGSLNKICAPGELTRVDLRAAALPSLLRQRCAECHGPDKHKGDLRLDTFEDLLRGGQDGPVVKAGHANKSPLIQCIISDSDADGHMPPEDHPQLSREEIALIEWWINQGAPASTSVIDLKPAPEIKRLVEGLSKRREFAK